MLLCITYHCSLPLLPLLQVLLLFPADYFILLRLIALNEVLRYSAPSYRKEKNELRVSSEQCQFSPSKLIWLSGDPLHEAIKS